MPRRDARLRPRRPHRRPSGGRPGVEKAGGQPLRRDWLRFPARGGVWQGGRPLSSGRGPGGGGPLLRRPHAVQPAGGAGCHESGGGERLGGPLYHPDTRQERPRLHPGAGGGCPLRRRPDCHRPPGPGGPAEESHRPRPHRRGGAPGRGGVQHRGPGGGDRGHGALLLRGDPGHDKRQDRRYRPGSGRPVQHHR